MSDGGIFAAFASVQQAMQQRQRTGSILQADRVGEFIQAALFGSRHHRLHVDNLNRFRPDGPGVKRQLLQLAGDGQHLRAKRIHKLAGSVLSKRNALRFALAHHPADSVIFAHAL